jgi:hypothetical protein
MVGHWMIVDVEDTKKPAKSIPTVPSASRLRGGGDGGGSNSAVIQESAVAEKSMKLKGAFKGLGAMTSAKGLASAAASRRAIIFQPMMPKQVPGVGLGGAKRNNTVHHIYIFVPELSSDRLAEMSRTMDEKERGGAVQVESS